MTLPSRRAPRAETFDVKNTHAWAPRRERQIFRVAGTFNGRRCTPGDAVRV